MATDLVFGGWSRPYFDVCFEVYVIMLLGHSKEWLRYIRK
jgi:hypothetical protein